MRELSQKLFLLSGILLCLLSPGSAVAMPPETLDDLKTARIAVLQGTVYDGIATERFPDASVQQYLVTSDVIAAVKSGRTDAAFSDEPGVKQVLRSEPMLRIFGPPLVSYPIGAGFKKDREPLRLSFNKFLADFKANGRYNELHRYWLDEDGLPDRMTPMAQSGQPLVIGTSGGGLPFTAVRDNQWVGFDVELGREFALSISRPVEFQVMDFGALIAAANSGSIDMIMASMFITEERKERIAFSDPYFELNGVAYGLKPDADLAKSQDMYLSRFWASVSASFYDNLIREDRYLLILNGLLITVIISLASTVLGTVAGGFICWLRMSSVTLLRELGRCYISFMRGTPVLVLLMLLYYLILAPVRIDPVIVSILAMGLNFAAFAAEIYRTGLNSIDPGQREAGISLGFTETQTFRYVLLPQTVRAILPVYKSEIISLTKMTSIVGYIAVQDLTKASDIIRARTFDAFFPLVFVAVLYLLLTGLLIWLLERGCRWSTAPEEDAF